MTDQDRIDVLMRDHNYNKSTAIAYVQAKGTCSYCGENTLVNFLGYYSAQIDHILPRSKYPDLELEQTNLVYACFFCNKLKSSFDPLYSLREKGFSISDPKGALLYHREDLLREVALHLQDRLQKERNRYKSIMNILCGVV